MPKIWKYLLVQYAPLFLMNLGSFVFLLLVSRAQEIARFAASSAHPLGIIYFTLYQIPYLLPLAIPLSSLVACYALFQRLSQSQEITAMRASSLSLGKMIFPIVLIGAMLNIANFAICSDLTPLCRFQSRVLAAKLSSQNPLHLLNQSFLSDTHMEYANLDRIQGANNVELVRYNPKLKKLELFLASRLFVEGGVLQGEDVLWLSSKKAQVGFDHLWMEQLKTFHMQDSALVKALRPNPKSNKSDYLQTAPLVKKIQMDKKSKAKRIHLAELFRRISLGLSPLTLTLLGISFGIRFERVPRRRHFWITSLLAAFFLISFVLLKSVKATPLLALTLLLIPHFIVVIASLHRLRQFILGRT